LVIFIEQVSAGWIREALLQVERISEGKNNKNNNNNNNNDALEYDHFGWSVSLYESTVAVGAYGDSTAGASAGAAYVFDRYDNVIYGWSLTQKLMPSDGAEYDAFGWSVSLHRNITAIGAYGHSSADRVFNGAVYIFQRIGHLSSVYNDAERLQSWTQTTMLLPSDGGTNDFFGWDVAVWNNLLAVGSHSWGSQDTDDTPAGAVYTYSTNEMHNTDRYITQIYSWKFDQKLVPSDEATRYFGNSISLSENTLLVGSFGDGYASSDAGQAFIYSATAMKDIDEGFGAGAGAGAASIDDPNDDAGSEYGAGEFSVISDQRYSWKQLSKLVPNTTENGIDFGFSVAIDDVTAVVGAVRADGRAVDSGAAFVFIKSNTKFEYPMSERTYLALVSFLPIFFLAVFCIIGSTMVCMKFKPNTRILTLFDLQDEEVEGGFDDDYDMDYSGNGYSTHSSVTMDSSVCSEAELISSRQQHQQQQQQQQHPHHHFQIDQFTTRKVAPPLR
jgi:hypothetical protein